MKTTLIWVFGKIGTGKTSYVHFHSQKQNCDALYIGKECRKKFGAGNMAKDSNPIAPENAEKFVRELVVNKISDVYPGNILYIDGMPRKPSQVRWIYENFDTPEFTNVITLFTCNEDVRRYRLLKRDNNNEEDRKLMEARMNNEAESILRVVEEIFILNNTFTTMKFICYDNSVDDPCFKYEVDVTRKMMHDTFESEHIERIIYLGKENTNIGRMFEGITLLNDKILKRFGFTTDKLYKLTNRINKCDNEYASIEWARRYIKAAYNELGELLKELPDTWWSLDKIDLRASRVELVDAWHFMVSASLALGMDAKFFAKTFFGKLRVNLDRQDRKYYKKNKGVVRDDEHIGKV